ncbi:MAG: SRPBCC family protein [Nocardioidaceae bacterium]
MSTATIECDEFVPHPPAAVWRALTEPALLARWWAPGDIEPVVGHRFELDLGPWGRQACRVLEVEPERLVSYTFGEGSLDSIVTWRLVPEGNGTRVLLVHEGLDLDSPLGRQAHDGMGKGWPTVLARLARSAQTG